MAEGREIPADIVAANPQPQKDTRRGVFSKVLESRHIKRFVSAFSTAKSGEAPQGANINSAQQILETDGSGSKFKHLKLTKRRLAKIAAGVVAYGFVPEAFQQTTVARSVPNPARRVHQEAAGWQVDRSQEIESLKQKGIKVLDSLPEKVARNNDAHYEPQTWEARRLAAFKKAVDNLPDKWWEKLKQEGGVDVFLFKYGGQEFHGMVTPPWGVKPYALALLESTMDGSPWGQLYTNMLVAHEITHLLTWQSETERNHWQNFMTSRDGLNLKTGEDGNIVFENPVIGIAAYGNTATREFIAVASSLYINGRDLFNDFYSGFLDQEQINLLYEKLKSEIYEDREYQSSPLKLLNEKLLKEVPRQRTQEMPRYPDVWNMPWNELKQKMICGDYIECGSDQDN